MGLVRKSRSEIEKIGSEKAREHIKLAIQRMRLFNKMRVAYFEELLKEMREQNKPVTQESKINRGPNPNLRHTGGAQLELVIDNETNQQ